MYEYSLRHQVWVTEINVRACNSVHMFVTKRWNRFFAIYVVRLALYVFLKNICDGVGCQNGSNGTPLDPPLFWLDNIFKIGIKGIVK